MRPTGLWVNPGTPSVTTNYPLNANVKLRNAVEHGIGPAASETCLLL